MVKVGSVEPHQLVAGNSSPTVERKGGRYVVRACGEWGVAFLPTVPTAMYESIVCIQINNIKHAEEP